MSERHPFLVIFGAPKSTKPSRIAENLDVFDFELLADEMAAIDGLDTGRRGGPAPDTITLEGPAARSRRLEHLAHHHCFSMQSSTPGYAR